jgi:adenine phosphoribosyltransferase
VRYALEYGHDELQMHEDAIGHGMRVLLADDLLATGGTLRAAADLVQACGGHVVGASVLIELDGLGGRAALGGLAVSSVLRY